MQESEAGATVPAGGGEARQVAEGVWQLCLATPFDVGPVNAYLLTDPEPVLVDCGPRVAQSEASLASGLAAAGVDPRNLRRIIITHGHVDHFGQAAQLAAASGAPVYAHALTLPWLLDFAAQCQRHLAFVDRLGYRHGMPRAVRLVALRHMADAQRIGGPVPRADALAQGELLYGRWRVVYTPGHAGGHISLFREQDGVLIAGDLLLPHITPNPTIEPPPPHHRRPPSLVAYLASLQRVSLLPVRLALPGHGDPITDVPGCIAGVLAHHRQRKRRVLTALAAGPQTAWQVATVLFAHHEGGQAIMTLMETIGHLEVLSRERRVRVAWNRGRATYASVPGRTDD